MHSLEKPPQESKIGRREALKKIGKGILGAGLMASGIGSLASKAEAGSSTVPRDKTRPDSDKGVPKNSTPDGYVPEEGKVYDPSNPNSYVLEDGIISDPTNSDGYVAGEGKIYDPAKPKTPTESPTKIPGVELGPNGKFNRKADGSLEIQNAIIRK